MRRAGALLAGLALLLAGTTASAAGPCESIEGEHEVLTLEETAAWLRIQPVALARAARRGEVPGREVAGAWRFARSALLAWLAGADRPAECFASPAPPRPAPAARSGAGMDERRMDRITGAGVGGTGTAADSSDAPPRRQRAQASEADQEERFGEAPEGAEAREVALREEAILLRGGQITLEPSFSYTRTDSGNLRSEALTPSLTARYGFQDVLQLSSSLPFSRTTTEFRAPGRTLDDSKNRFGDIALGATYQALEEAMRWPAAFVSANLRIPTDGTNAYGLGGGVSLTNTVDPATLFATLAYLHTFDAGSRGGNEDTITTNFGFAFRINDQLAYRTSVSSVFNPRSEFDGTVLAGDENHFLNLGLTWLLAEDVYVEPSVAYRLNGPEDSVSFGLRVPYIFDLSSR